MNPKEWKEFMSAFRRGEDLERFRYDYDGPDREPEIAATPSV